MKNKKIKNFNLLTVLLIISLFLTGFASVDLEIETYEDENVKFNYPADWQIVEMKDTEIFEVFITSQEFGDTVFNGFEIYGNEEVLNQLNQVVSLQKTKLDEPDNSFEEIGAEIKKIGRIELIEEGKRDGNLFYLFKEKGEAVDIKGHDLTLLIQADKSTAYVFGYVGFHGNFNQDLGHEIINSFKLK